MTFKNCILFFTVFSLGVFSSDWLKNAGRYLISSTYDSSYDVSRYNPEQSITDNKGIESKKNTRFLAGSRNPYSSLQGVSSEESRPSNDAHDASAYDDPENIFSWALIDRLVRARSFDKAISLLREYLVSNPDSPRAWATLGHIYDKKSSLQDSVDSWLRYLEYESDSNQTGAVIETLKQRFLSMLSGAKPIVANSSWMIEKLIQLVDMRSNDGELHWMLASLYLESEDDYQAQYHALMAANDPAAKKRAEEILAQLNGEALPEDLSIPLVRYGNQYLVEVSIEGNLALLLLDTGASISGVSRAFVNNYPYIVKDTKPIRLNTASGVETSYLFTVDQLSIESLLFNNHILALLPMAEQAEFDGLLGVDILGRFDFVIDQDALLLRLKPRDQ